MNDTPRHTQLCWLSRFILAKVFLLLSLQTTNAQTLDRQSKATDAGHTNAARRQQLEKIVVSRLARYSALYPDMDFAVLDTAGDFRKNMQALLGIIGKEAVPLDYEHPQDLRHDMLMAMLMRIEVLLQTEVGSATLFKPGIGASARRQRVCVVTVNPWAIAADDQAATDHLLELPPKELATIPPEHHLDHVSHLKFALDHEIYHCLDAAYNGAIPMSQRKYWGDYYSYKNESGADAFGILMHMAEHGAITPYARMLKNIRGLTLLNGDINHYTYKSIDATLQIDAATLKGKSVKALFQLATCLRDKVVGNYENYVRYACAAEQAMQQFGNTQDVGQYRDIKPDHATVKRLVDATKNAYQNLTGKKFPVQAGPR